MAETVEEAAVDTAAAAAPVSRLCLCEQYVRVTEGAALTAARWLGRADQEGAERDAAEAMRRVLDDFPIDGRVVIGSVDEESPLYLGGSIGAGGAEVDLALDPLEGRGVVARGGNGAMSMIAVGERDSLLKLPDMYMRKLAVGPRARGSIDLLKPMGENVHAIADAFGRRPNDITTIVLDRPRHHDLIEDIRASGARIKLIQDGTVTASISAAIRGTNDHLAVGIGGTRQAVMSAAALRCLGGEVQAQLWPTSRREIEQARELGIEDPGRVFTTEDALARHVHALQLGAFHGRDPFLRARAARGSAAAGLLARVDRDANA
jgi:fructose-1,6-bisphosphatase II